METIVPPHTGSNVAEEIAVDSSATAIAVAEPVQARADDNASATVIPFPTRPTADLTLVSLHPPIVPCTDHVPEFTRRVLAGVVEDSMRAKNVPLPPEDVTAAADAMFAALTLAEAYQFALGDLAALAKVARLVNDHLDGIAVQRIILTARVVAAKPADDSGVIATVTAVASGMIAKHGPDKSMVWPDLIETAHCVIAQTAGADGAEHDALPPANRRARRATKKNSRKARRGRS